MMSSLIWAIAIILLNTGYVEPACELTHCIEDNCSTWFCNRCKDGHYLDTTSNTSRHFCHACPSSCDVCDGYAYCSTCNMGFYGYRCKSHCAWCCKNNTCEKQNGTCTNGATTGNYRETDDTCSQCPPRCFQCSSASSCSLCKTANYWGATCQYTCSNCASCNKNNGCSSCNDGYYTHYNSTIGGNDCRQCPNLCTSCTSNTNCSSCTRKTNWGTSCQHTCDNCATCSKSDGCSLCNTGYYQHYDSSLGGGVCKKCPESCTSCSDDNNCQSCVSGYWGTACEIKCPDNCRECTSNLNCYSCKIGHWGSYCQNSCAGCKSSACDKLYGCSQGCTNGYYPQRNNNENHCKKCMDACETCLNSSTCSSCTPGYYSNTNFFCVTCPSNCLDETTCDKRNGFCSGGCNEYWSGDQCGEPCPSNCRQCDQFNKSSCSLCEKEFYGDSCEHTCNAGCVERNQSNTCDKTNGTCYYDCKETFWGNKCEEQCGVGCSGNACNRTTGYCLGPCTETHFGQMCDSQCSENCNITTGRLCNETYGYCLNGCQVGWFGDQCNEACSKNCKEKICDRNNGSCTSGCINGYTGSMCMTALLKEDPGSNAAAIGGGAGAGGVFLVILIVIVVVIVLKRRKTSSKMEPTNGRSVEKTVGPVYSNINEARIEKEKTEIAGVTNIVYDNTAVRMSDVSENVEVINVNTSPARPTSVDYLEDVETGDDNQRDNGEAGASAMADDTYYNIAGQRVAVARLVEYIKNKSQEDLFKDFEKIPKGLLKSSNEAVKSENATKNKYRAIYPYDENRVILLDGGSDYINASYIDGYNRSREYIASSGPFQRRSYDTTSDFWRMIFQERCETLVMLTQPVEDGQTKCTKYWPDADESCQYGEINITCLTEDVYADFTVRILAVTKGKETINIRHVHFTAWPDKGIPHDVTSMIELRQKVRSLHKDKESPIIVHCSAGIGRTGTFIVLDMLTFEGEDRGSVDIFGSLVSLRNQRCNMVQTPKGAVLTMVAECSENMYKIMKYFMPTKLRWCDDRASLIADEYRVKLHENRKPGASDYINAVYMNSFRRQRKFICAQSPLPATVVDFLSLVLQERCTCIVSMEEPDIADKTVKLYWPADNQIVKHGVFSVSCKDSKTTAHYVSKILSITYHGPDGEESRDVNLFIFTNWPKDLPVPKTSDSLLELVKTVDAMNRTPGYEAPIVIHCRTGAERSCLYCAVSVLIEKMEIEHEVSVVNTLRQIKARRLSAISTVEQYKFCHQAVISYLQSFDIYSNFGLKEADA